jgi:RNA polymerase sigma-70 factor (ECF subfamily)
MAQARDTESGSVGQPFPAASSFTTTHWSVVLAAGHSSAPGACEAMETLCRAYWYPLYAYVRRQGHPPEHAQDLTQEFFAHLLEKKCVAQADPARGRFRTFLLSALKHFLVNEWKRAARQKRGGGGVTLSWNVLAAEPRYAAEPLDNLTPEVLYERRWAVTLLDRVLDALRQEYVADDKGPLFDQLKGYVWGEQSAAPGAVAAARLGLSEGAVKTAAHRLRLRCRALLRAEIAHTVATPAEVDEELRHLLAVLSA